MISYKITFTKHLKHLYPLLLVLFGLTFLISYDWANRNENNKGIYIVYLIFVVVTILHMYLHIEYYLTNRGYVMNYNKKDNLIKVKQRRGKIIISSLNIEKIEIIQSRYYKKKGSVLSTDNYRFYKFYLTSQECVIITSLLCGDFDYYLDEKTEVKERVFASIYLS